MFEVGTKLIRIQTGQYYVIEKTELSKVKGKVFKKEVLYHLKHENGPIDLIVHEDELKRMFKFVKQTNADRIRSMNDEELAKFTAGLSEHCLAGIGECDCSRIETRTCYEVCEKITMKWLQSEAEE